MKISNAQYAQTLFDLVKDGQAETNRSAVAAFAKLLIARHDAFRLDKIMSEFEKLWDKAFDIIKAEVSSVSPLSTQTATLLEKYIKKTSGAREISMNFRIDKDILGGVVIKYGDKIFDAGLKSRLEKMKEKIIN
jgi:F-type H+-transporting ATPase subunit delta